MSHGLHRPDTLREDLSSWQMVLPSSARFTHLTGAELRGWWLPPLPVGLPVFVANGDSDPMILPHFSYLLAGLIPQARLKIYPDSAHGKKIAAILRTVADNLDV